ncbi:hypothetical protein NCCP1664_23070 [Zafaria cholistanensis]|uniref:Coenzyme Q-binding protein COQ10 START domain-containing protein n=1 Tax=Zafaria cholistanensis TaxID=1682741 RepID=A0A5A7NUI8_9MICC|nr:SRPBCC family protein [Zafaria cholistanensis]GER23812.1 hypothetical protein NCCP1664_23070 [Zafaria cholistanensis]
MAHIEETIEVGVVPEVAYEHWTRYDAFPEFLEGVVSVTRVDDSTTHWVVESHGEQREFDTHVIERRPGELIHWRSDGALGGEGTMLFEPVQSRSSAFRKVLHGATGEQDEVDPAETHTRITVRMAWEDKTAAERFGATFGTDSRKLKKDLRNFRKYIEKRRADAA